MQLIETQDGSFTLISDDGKVSYHSKFGAIQECRHVYMEAGLFYKSIGNKELNILEMGFGTGLNTYLTYLEAQKLDLNVNYVGVDINPLSFEIVEKLNYAALSGGSAGKEVFLKMHQLKWGENSNLSSTFTLLKVQGDFGELDHSNNFDLIYFDAFEPGYSPEHWELEMMMKMYDALVHGGILVTYCAKGSFKRALKQAGFDVTTIKGPPGKREMIRAIKSW